MSKSDDYSVEDMSEMLDTSEFDPDVAFEDGCEVFDSTNKPSEQKISELGTSLRLDTTDELR